MNAEEFRRHGKEAIDFIADYLETIRERPVLPSVEPGFLQDLLPGEAPLEPEAWGEIFRDFERVIMPGVTHWQSPNFYAFYPAGHSYPSIMGEILGSGLGIVGFTWMTNPIITELEVIMMNWLGKLIGLPEDFLSDKHLEAGGVIQGSASESILVSLLAAKERTLRRVKSKHPDWDEDYVKSNMIAYSSDQANSAVEKAGRLSSVKIKLLKSDEKCQFRGETLREAMEGDIKRGLIPTFVCATLGTTGTCAFDKLDELGPICNDHDVWFHVDAAYAGAAFVCPEYRHLLAGVEHADSFNFNCHKWFMVNFDCSAFWIKNSSWLTNTFGVERIYLNHQAKGVPAAPDYKDWEISLGRRFRALKLWFTIRSYGIKGLQQYIRHHVFLAKQFESFVQSDERFEVVCEASMGLVCFRLKGPNALTERLLDRLTSRKQIYVVAGSLNEEIFIRFAICGRTCEVEDVQRAWGEIRGQTVEVLVSADRHRTKDYF